MPKYHVLWSESSRRRVTIDADGRDEALEEFWLNWHRNGMIYLDEEIVEVDNGPSDIKVTEVP